MTSRFQKLLLASAFGVGLTLCAGAFAQQDAQDPLADLLNSGEQVAPESAEEAPATGLDLRSSDFPLTGEVVETDPLNPDGAEQEGQLPRLAPIFAPGYDASDLLPQDDLTDDGVVDGISPDADGADLADQAAGVLDFEYMVQPAVILRGLDKITGRSTDLEVAVGEHTMLGGMRVTVRACHQTPPTEPPESIAYIEVEDYGFAIEDPEALADEVDLEKRVFNGWMFASSPGLNGLEHAVYDVWVIRCMDAVPVLSDTGSEL